MRDGNQDDDLDQPDVAAEPEKPVEDEYPVDRLRKRFTRSFGNRPVMVYFVLIAGAATLILLLAIVWISATGNGTEERPICTAITTSEAEQAILSGQVERVKVLVDRDDPLQTLTGVVLELTDGTCRQPAQGADVRNDLYLLLGVVEHYNNFGEQRVRVQYQRQEIQDDLLSTSTPMPTPTVPPTETLTPTTTFTLEPTATVTETPALPTQVAEPTGTPQSASPSALLPTTSATSSLTETTGP